MGHGYPPAVFVPKHAGIEFTRGRSSDHSGLGNALSFNSKCSAQYCQNHSSVFFRRDNEAMMLSRRRNRSSYVNMSIMLEYLRLISRADTGVRGHAWPSARCPDLLARGSA